MTSRFGDLYRAYLARTPRFVPNPALWTARPAISVEYAYVFVCLRDTLWFALAVPGFIAIDWGQEAGLLPVLFRLPQGRLDFFGLNTIVETGRRLEKFPVIFPVIREFGC